MIKYLHTLYKKTKTLSVRVLNFKKRKSFNASSRAYSQKTRLVDGVVQKEKLRHLS